MKSTIVTVIKYIWLPFVLLTTLLSAAGLFFFMLWYHRLILIFGMTGLYMLYLIVQLSVIGAKEFENTRVLTNTGIEYHFGPFKIKGKRINYDD